MTLDRVVEEHDPVLITRDRGKPPVVLISLEDFASYEKTAHLMRNPRNAKRLLEAIGEFQGAIRKV